ncbi:MAG: hypothetical protein ACRDQH_17630 [Pseudonocardiaceae bacterium]
MPDRSHASLSPTTLAERKSMRRSPLSDLGTPIASAGVAADYSYTAPRSEIDHSRRPATTLDVRTPTHDDDLARDGEMAVGTPARDAYLDARAQAGAVGIALADPRMRRALILDGLQHNHDRIASSLPEGFDTSRKPVAWRARERSEWQRHQKTARALDANAEWQEQLRAELGPNSEQVVRRALALAEAREQILARTPELQRSAIDEELARDPEWLTETLGPRPEQGAGRWQTLAGQLAANRVRFLVVDDADPGIRPEQSQLAQQVAQFQAGARLAQSVGLTPSIGFGM